MTSARSEMERARTAVLNVEKEINTIKKAVRELANQESTNKLTISYNALKRESDSDGDDSNVDVDADGDGLKDSILTLQCSSPIEKHELILGKDSVELEDVDCTVATITLTLEDYESDAVDLEAGEFNMDLGTMECTNIPRKFEVVLFQKSSEGDQSGEVKDEQEKDDDQEENAKEEVEVEEVNSVTVTLEVSFSPGAKDKTQKMYDLLNKASKKKANAINELRKAAAVLSREEQSAAPASKSVKAGFLNKGTSGVAKKGFWSSIQQRIVQPALFVGGILSLTKNYLIFFGGVAIIHLKGQYMALPPPVV